MAGFFEDYDLLLRPGVPCPPFDVTQRYPPRNAMVWASTANWAG